MSAEPSEGLREIVRAVEAGWQGTLEAVRASAEAQVADVRKAAAEQVAEVRKHEAQRTEALRKRVRSLTVSLLVMLVATIAACTAGLAVLSAQTNRLDTVVAEQAASRKAALIDRCRQSNDLATGLRSFVRQVAPKLLPLAERKFQVVADCERYANHLLRAP